MAAIQRPELNNQNIFPQADSRPNLPESMNSPHAGARSPSPVGRERAGVRARLFPLRIIHRDIETAALASATTSPLLITTLPPHPQQYPVPLGIVAQPHRIVR